MPMGSINDKISELQSAIGNKMNECLEEGKQIGFENAINDCIQLVINNLIDRLDLREATKYGNMTSKQRDNSYATLMKYEIADAVSDLLDNMEELKRDLYE